MLWREVRYQGEALATIAAFDMAGRVRAHCWLVIACDEGSVSKATFYEMVSTLNLMKF